MKKRRNSVLSLLDINANHICDAASRGDITRLRKFVNEDALDANDSNFDLRTALHVAALRVAALRVSDLATVALACVAAYHARAVGRAAARAAVRSAVGAAACRKLGVERRR